METVDNVLDQYYTDPLYAEHFFGVVSRVTDLGKYDWFLEPSAGTGSFFRLLEPTKRIGLDLEPKCPDVEHQNFLEWEPPRGRILTIGNPPFGKNASMAVNFFNYAARFSDTIAFILPRTFRKRSVIKRLNETFHRVWDETVPERSFIFKHAPYDVWSCAQIWQRQSYARPVVEPLSIDLLSDWFVKTTPANATFAFQRVGARAGAIKTDNLLLLSKESHYFFEIKQEDALRFFKALSFEDIKKNTAGNPSIALSEIVEVWFRQYPDIRFDTLV